jgi:hypothetical protein
MRGFGPTPTAGNTSLIPAYYRPDDGGRTDEAGRRKGAPPRVLLADSKEVQSTGVVPIGGTISPAELALKAPTTGTRNSKVS